MTMADVIVLGGSLVVIAIMVAAAALLGFRQTSRILDEASLRTLVADADPDARVEQALLDAEGRAALALLSDGRMIAARAVGDGFALRSFASSGLKLRQERRRLIATFGELGFPPLHIALKDDAPPPWLADLARAGGKK